MSDVFEPKLIGFLCNWCAYAGADLAGVSRLQYPPNHRTVRVMCSGRVDPTFVIDGFRNGYDGVMVLGCHLGDCHYLEGNYHALNRMNLTGMLLDLAGIGRGRLIVDWVSSAEGPRFAEVVKGAVQQVRDLGPFDPQANALQIEACMRTLDAPGIRWLLGMQRQITERANVYNQKIPPAEFERILQQAAEDEYRIRLVQISLENGPMSVPELSESIGAAKPEISNILTEMERRGIIGLAGYEGRVPKFAVV
ncbi:MAG: hydrogenase iron-sulfur subunit [Proteobacteria bacterium]|nr:hydrogenase iron-sulfur subunit [Pseudomonadota bacterium]